MRSKPVSQLISPLIAVVLLVICCVTNWALCQAEGGPVSFGVKNGLPACLFAGFSLLVCLGFLVLLALQRTAWHQARWFSRVQKLLWAALIVSLLPVLVYHPQMKEVEDVEALPIPGVLPLLGQLSEEAPDFSTQQPLTDGFVFDASNFFAPLLLILRQDGPAGEWYHIHYCDLRKESWANRYTAEQTRLIQAQGGTAQETAAGQGWVMASDSGGTEQKWLVSSGTTVVQVTYYGSQDLLSHAAAWETALFHGG